MKFKQLDARAFCDVHDVLQNFIIVLIYRYFCFSVQESIKLKFT